MRCAFRHSSLDIGLLPAPDTPSSTPGSAGKREHGLAPRRDGGGLIARHGGARGAMAGCRTPCRGDGSGPAGEESVPSDPEGIVEREHAHPNGPEQEEEGRHALAPDETEPVLGLQVVVDHG
eukprot:scaffold10504_cov124-Isochrysis_galbana.AAC.7